MEKTNIKRGFALEGGGAKGSYHMGVLKAYLEAGYEFQGVVGTSIGAINGAMLASGEFEKAFELWETIGVEHLFDQAFLDAVKLDQNFPGNITTALRKLLLDRGIDHSRIKSFLGTYIDEEKVRKSDIDFGLVTYSLSERKAYEVFIEDIPEGKLIDYILASAKLPFFAPLLVDDNRFIDGGVINNCPINMLIDKGYDEIVAVRTKSFGIFKRYDKNANVTMIETDDHLGHVLEFNSENAKANIKRGYCDAVRAIEGLPGSLYYLRHVDGAGMVEKLLTLAQDTLSEMAYFKRETGDLRRFLLEYVLPEIGEYLNLERHFSYEELVAGMLEYVATRKGIDRYEVYDFADFCGLLRDIPLLRSENIFSRVGFDFSERKSILVEQLVMAIIC